MQGGSRKSQYLAGCQAGDDKGVENKDIIDAKREHSKNQRNKQSPSTQNAVPAR
jgi:hypothetical protein